MNNQYRVQQLTKAGRPASNQFVISHDAGKESKVIFQSYNTIIAVIEATHHDVYRTTRILRLDPRCNYSRTTSRHLYNFLQQYGYQISNIKELDKALTDGTAKIEELNTRNPAAV